MGHVVNAEFMDLSTLHLSMDGQYFEDARKNASVDRKLCLSVCVCVCVRACVCMCARACVRVCVGCRVRHLLSPSILFCSVQFVYHFWGTRRFLLWDLLWLQWLQTEEERFSISLPQSGGEGGGWVSSPLFSCQGPLLGSSWGQLSRLTCSPTVRQVCHRPCCPPAAPPPGHNAPVVSVLRLRAEEKPPVRVIPAVQIESQHIYVIRYYLKMYSWRYNLFHVPNYSRLNQDDTDRLHLNLNFPTLITFNLNQEEARMLNYD